MAKLVTEYRKNPNFTEFSQFPPNAQDVFKNDFDRRFSMQLLEDFPILRFGIFDLKAIAITLKVVKCDCETQEAKFFISFHSDKLTVIDHVGDQLLCCVGDESEKIKNWDELTEILPIALTTEILIKTYKPIYMHQ